MIFLLCFLTILGLGRCLDQLPTRYEIEGSINRTIDEVERLIREDPTLPRLSRGQIVDILHNITAKEVESFEESVEKMRSDYQRALMVVLPYNVKGSDEDLRDLLTKPPMVQVIPDTETMLPFASIQEEPLPSQPVPEKFNNDLNPKNSDEVKAEPQYKNHRNSYSDINLDTAPERFSFDLNNLNSAKPKHPTTKSPFSKPSKVDTTTLKPKLEVIYSSSVTERITTPTLEEVSSSTVPTTRASVNILTSDQWRYNAPPSTTYRPRTHPPTARRQPSTTPRPSTTTTTTRLSTTVRSPTTKKPSKVQNKSQFFLPTVISEVSKEAPLPPFKKLPITSSRAPDVVTFNMADMMMNDAPTAAIYVTPMSSSVSASADPVFTISTVDLQSEPPKPPMRDEVASLLAAIGLQPMEEKVNSKEVLNALPDDVFGKDFVIPESSNFIPHQVSLAPDSVDSSSIVSQNTFENAPGDLRKGVNNLSPDVQLLFQRFGLPVSGKESEATSTTTLKPETQHPTVAKNSWSLFKPLPTSEVKDEAMRNFLATFGLGVAEKRSKKAMKTQTTTEIPSVIEVVPGNMKGILENIGLITKTKPKTEHVFKPHETSIDDEKQRSKINELLDTVKLVQEGKANISDLHNTAEQLSSTETLPPGPDPTNIEEILKIYSEDLRNEVKRQESKDDLNLTDMAASDQSDTDMASSEISETPSNATVTSNSTSTNFSANLDNAKSSNSSASSADSTASGSDDSDTGAAEPATTTASSTSSAASSNLDDLADSFGGTTQEPDPVLPTPRKTGLYFLVDWNTFLEVGEEGRDRVNLRFAPKVGDRTRFIPVVVP